jgi:hypothetical protein
MTTSKRLARLEALIWTLIYGGLFGMVLGLATERLDDAIGWSLIVAGALVAAVGVALIFVRARLQPAPAPKAQSDA